MIRVKLNDYNSLSVFNIASFSLNYQMYQHLIKFTVSLFVIDLMILQSILIINFIYTCRRHLLVIKLFVLFNSTNVQQLT